MQEVQGEEANEQEDQEAARTRPEQPVIKPDRPTDQYRQALLLAADLQRLVQRTEVLLAEGVDRHQHDHHQHRRAHHAGRHQRHRGGTGERHDERTEGRWHDQPPIQCHSANERTCREGGAAHRGQLVAAQQRRRLRGRQHVEQRWNLDQPAPTYGGVDQAGSESEQGKHSNIHHDAVPGSECRPQG
ncbi:hypothetical protein D3C79_381290 [compost metagenome]